MVIKIYDRCDLNRLSVKTAAEWVQPRTLIHKIYQDDLVTPIDYTSAATWVIENPFKVSSALKNLDCFDYKLRLGSDTSTNLGYAAVIKDDNTEQ